MQSYRSLRDGKAFDDPTVVEIALKHGVTPAQARAQPRKATGAPRKCRAPTPRLGWIDLALDCPWRISSAISSADLPPSAVGARPVVRAASVHLHPEVDETRSDGGAEIAPRLSQDWRARSRRA